MVQIWQYQGANTLATYLQKADPLAALSRSLLVPKEAVAATVMQQLFQAVHVSCPCPGRSAAGQGCGPDTPVLPG